MNSRAVRVLAALLVFAAADVCVWLGFWQLGRAGEKRAAHAASVALLEQPPLVADSGAAALPPGRRVVLHGTWDRERYILLSGRTNLGAAGVHVVTPLVLASGERVLVERGWLASADARIAHPEHWPDSVAVVNGVAERLPVSRRVFAWAPLTPHRPGAELWSARALDSAQVVAHVPAVRTSAYVRAVAVPGDTASERAGLVTPPLAPPESGERMHLSYAIQWFAFALIIAGGAIAFARRRRAAAAA